MPEGLSHHPESKAIEVKSCASRIYELESKRKKVSELPENLPLVVRNNNKDARRLHTVSLVLSHETYPPERVKNIVKNLSKGNYNEEEKKEKVNEISEIRIFYQFRRSAESLLDSSHKPPPLMDNLIVSMGKLKDHPGKEKKYAKRLLKDVIVYNKNMDKIDKGFKPTNVEDFENYLYERISIMKAVLAAGDPEDIELQHIVRKKGTRELMVLFSLEIIRKQNLDRKGAKKPIKAYSLFHKYDDLFQKDLQKYHKDKKAYNKLKPKKRKKAKKPRLRIRPKKNKELIKALDDLEKQWGIKPKADKKGQKKHKRKKK